MIRWLISILVLLFIGAAFLFWAIFFSARPPLTTDPATLAGDGASVNYCELPVLDGSGKRAVDIAKGNTPGCAYSHFPLPILAECTEPLSSDADDIRGLWVAVAGDKLGHLERVEQCGSRVVITAAGIIHDGGPNSTGGMNSNDTEGGVAFTLGDREYCPRTSASMTWDKGILNFRPFGIGPIVVRRYLENEQLVWEYIDGSVTRMERLCTLPEAHRTPAPRGRRIALW
ncbi:hypothetical protein [Parahalioglobus pacificus]|uniref:Uncharacterized protein n=1 Tax=Parahalioglobus pacificus TaxID=930806 RepID=A0A918XLS4_9GAMM|nr:hypothetical protein [Halioglobus pacificus]GHD38340.1 hypothetical protein GCM10007053_28790 [Halioglobus pacificus]